MTLTIPSMAMNDNLCNVRCEQFVLRKFGITVPEKELVENAASPEWLARYGLCVSRRYYASLNDVKNALDLGSAVIVSVDAGEIDGNELVESIEDRFQGEFPDHCICVVALEDDIVAYNPIFGENPQRIPRDRFIDAWRDSKFYMVAVNRIKKVSENYSPAPLDLDDVTLPEGLEELTEAIAENTHEVWAKKRMDAGWTYGAARDDEAKKHPNLLPYSSLSEEEKDLDRATAMNAIKLIMKLGYKIESKSNKI